MKINDIEINADLFAYDGCHKIYLIEDDNDKKEAFQHGYDESDIYPISEIQTKFENSCPLRFISTWKLESIVNQCQEAIFN